MNQELFAAVDAYIDGLFAPEDEALTAALRASAAAGLPEIQVAPNQGKLLYLLAKLCGARRVLEIGTLGGYSTIWMGRALPPEGRIVTLEFSPDHAAVARANLERAELLVGPALERLPQLLARGEAPFDMVFLDADKISYPAYLEWALRLTRPGSLIVADNVVRDGKVLQPAADDESAIGAREFNAALAADARVEAVIMQSVGVKGHDGMAIARVR
jgi:predicted O-methyltransferase YrrM